MRICFFHLMPYRFLPDDFQDRYRSVWVDVPSSLFDAGKAHELYNEYLDELEHAERCGFDGLCVNEHHQNAYGLMPSPNLMAAALTRRTSRAAIIVLGNSLALYNPPVRVAEEFAMLDVMSGGRLVAGFPLGTSMDSNFAYGVNPATLRERYYEAHDLVMQAWTRPEVFSFNGKYTQLRYVNLWPRPLQTPHPPVWIPGGGSLETWEWAARRDYVYCYLSYYGYKRGKATMDGFWGTLDALGIDDNPYRAGFLQLVCVSETDEQAERDYFRHVDYFYQKCLHVWEGFAEAPGYRTLKTLQAGVRPQVGDLARKIRQSLDWKKYLDQGYVIAGSPATVCDQLKDCIRKLRVGHLMVLLQIGSMPKELVFKNTELFGQEVLPALRDLWPGYEDHWWPAGVRPGAPGGPEGDGRPMPEATARPVARG
jgi:alkanesulfonate monooxygenase SsuD/methylene tetrahydromethanopterin reductase-like flavin-dependent oxidoreductase (luciferase family)